MADIILYEGTNELNVGLTPIPLVANLHGRVTAVDTGEPIEGAWVTVSTATTVVANTRTDANGYYEIADIEPGDYYIIAMHEIYKDKKVWRTLAVGDNEVNFSLELEIVLANLYGTVTNAETGYAIEGVKVTIDGTVTYTNSGGAYGFEGLTPGTYTITFEKEGYETVTR